MIDETEERQLYIVSDELPAMKRSIKRLADDEKTSSTELMIRALCHHYGLAPPVRERRPARKVENAESLQLMVPTDLWLAIHNESGALLTSKKAVVLAVFHELIDKGHVAKKRKAK